MFNNRLHSKILKTPDWKDYLPSDCYLDEVLLLAMPKKDRWGGLVDGTWAGIRALRARRWRRFACGGGCARGVVRLRFAVVLWVFSGWGPAACRFWEVLAGEAQGAAAGGGRTALRGRVFSRACCCRRCVRGVRVSGLAALSLGLGDCSVPMNLWTNARGSIDGHLPIVWRVPYKWVYPRLKAGDAIDASIRMHGGDTSLCMPQAAALCMSGMNEC